MGKSVDKCKKHFRTDEITKLAVTNLVSRCLRSTILAWRHLFCENFSIVLSKIHGNIYEKKQHHICAIRHNNAMTVDVEFSYYRKVY